MRATSLFGVAALLGALSSSAAAERSVGSLLLFPEFDNRPGSVQFLTVTNTSLTAGIVVEIVYIDGDDCSETNRLIPLTPGDTFTCLTSAHNPEMERGYAYAFARGKVTGLPIGFDHLAGASFSLHADGLGEPGPGMGTQSSAEPFVFLSAVPAGFPTDKNDNGLRELDGREYMPAPDKVMIPRFFGQSAMVSSRLLLIGLTGGSQFETTVDFLVFNDNEQVFSAEYTFQCWDSVALEDISGAFSNGYLHDLTENDPDEILGLPRAESGWIWIDGAVASSSATTIFDPAVLAVLTERIGTHSQSMLPFGEGLQPNGALLARSVDGTE